MVKIERSKNGKFVYFLSNLDGMFYAEYHSELIVPQMLTGEEIYNFYCIEDDICIAFASQRFTVMIFKGSKNLNVLHSDEDTLKYPFLTGLSRYTPKLANDGKLLWLEGRKGVKYLQYNSKEIEVEPGELLRLWSNTKNFCDFIILTVEELPKRELILGLAFEDTTENILVQIYNLKKKEAHSVALREHPQFKSKVFMTCVSLENESTIVACGYIKRPQTLGANGKDLEKEETDSLISICSIVESKDSNRFDFIEQDMVIFQEYAKFVNLKKIDENEFFACAFWDLLILRYEEGVLYTCHVFNDLHDGMIYDVAIFGNCIYTVSEGSENLCKEVEFKNSISHC